MSQLFVFRKVKYAKNGTEMLCDLLPRMVKIDIRCFLSIPTRATRDFLRSRRDVV